MQIIAMGYFGTGSSAITHLLKEYEDITDGGFDTYEHLPLYTPHGLFDLEDTLLYSNSLFRSDAAIREFISAMERLDKTDFGWFGGYQKRYGEEFGRLTKRFVESIKQFETEGNWFYDYVEKEKATYYIKDVIKKILGKAVGEIGHRICIESDNKIFFSFVEPSQFYKAAKQFVDDYIRMINKTGKKDIVLDQLILPQQLKRINNYFDEESRFIVVDRDPRDVYIITKYIWPQILKGPHVFPTDVEKFVDFYKKFRAFEEKNEDKRIIRIRFEDLIYRYDETVQVIERFLSINPQRHINKQAIFIPEKSIYNTQNFTMKEEWKKEVSIIEKEFPELLYQFPYKIKTSYDLASDP